MDATLRVRVAVRMMRPAILRCIGQRSSCRFRLAKFLGSNITESLFSWLLYKKCRLARKARKEGACVSSPRVRPVFDQPERAAVRDPRHRGPPGFWAGKPSPGDSHICLRSTASCASERISRYLPETYRGVPPAVPAGFLTTVRSCTGEWLKAFAKDGSSAQDLDMLVKRPSL